MSQTEKSSLISTVSQHYLHGIVDIVSFTRHSGLATNVSLAVQIREVERQRTYCYWLVIPPLLIKLVGVLTGQDITQEDRQVGCRSGVQNIFVWPAWNATIVHYFRQMKVTKDIIEMRAVLVRLKESLSVLCFARLITVDGYENGGLRVFSCFAHFFIKKLA